MELPASRSPQDEPVFRSSIPDSALVVGLGARLESTVRDADTAQTLGSGDVPVLGTPRVLALAEAATVAATTPYLASGRTSVGTKVELEHLAATTVGRTVTATARLTQVHGERLVFEVTLHEGNTLVARGRVERIVVDRERFLSRASGG